jgi:hypothetical protein
VRQRRLFQAFSVTVLGVALACAPMAVASAKSKPKHHAKAKHHHTTTTTKPKTASKGGLNPGSKLCVTLANAESSSGNLGSNIEKSIEQGMASGNYASVKAAMLASINASMKDEGAAESALSGAPANVQAAMKGLFSFVGSYETAISNSTSITQLATSLGSLAQTSQVEADSLTVANYVTEQCGTPTTTTPTSLP